MEHVKLAQVAVEVWRLGQRLDAPEPSRERLDDSLRRLVNALEEAGIRYSDPIGQPYTAGMNAEVIASGRSVSRNSTYSAASSVRPDTDPVSMPARRCCSTATSRWCSPR